MKIMVTGGAGFIGSNVVDGYIGEGHEVVVLDNLSTGKVENLNPRAGFYETDIRSRDLPGIMAKERPEIINHHAAQISVPASVTDPLTDADINLIGLLNLLECAVNSGVKKVIFISSGGAVYGEAEQCPTPEDYPPKPLSPYAVSKFCSEYYLYYYSRQYGLDFTILRYSNIYGPRQIPHGEAGVVAIFMDNLLRGKRSVLNHFPDDPEGMIRDYCYVGDVVEANLKALHKGSGDFFNIGSGKGTKTLELYRTIYEAFKEVRFDTPCELAEPVRREARAGDIPRSCLVIEKAARLLEWTPGTGLGEGIRLTLKWWISRHQGKDMP